MFRSTTRHLLTTVLLLGAFSAPAQQSPPPPAEEPPPPAAGAPQGQTAAPAPAPAPAGGAPQQPALSEEELKELQGAVGGTEKAAAGPEVFDEGVKAYYDKNYVFACKRLWDFMSASPPGEKNYGYAEFFMAESLARLGFTHAAIEYYFNVAKNRTRPELLADALSAIEAITRKNPFDEDLILKDLIYDTSFGFLRDDLNDFVEYYRGLLDYRNGFIRWGEKHFASITKDSYYYFKARYVQAVYELVRQRLDDALKIFQEILESNISQLEQADVINNARQSIARILFEQKKYQQAYDMYEQIRLAVENQASVFLEEAWTMYYLQDYRRAMGLLYALEAPAFYRFFNPEKYLLKALIYQNLCHYNVSKDAVSEFRRGYGEALAAVYDRVDLEKNEILMDAALQDPTLDGLSRFARLLDTEMGRLDDFSAAWEENGLNNHLRRMYDLKLKYVNRKLKIGLDEALRQVANKLLEFEEQMNLLEYEIGLAIYKRIKGAPTSRVEEKKSIPKSGPEVYYAFDGEFWNDELHDFNFFIENRCFEEERWE